jgi:hypothetical protein
MMDDTLRKIEEAGFNWHVARGRVRATEPLYAIQLFDADENSRSTDLEPVFEVEDDNIHACLSRCQAFIDQQAK